MGCYIPGFNSILGLVLTTDLLFADEDTYQIGSTTAVAIATPTLERRTENYLANDPLRENK